MDLGKHGSMREIECTDLRNILLFLMEYAQWKVDVPAEPKQVYADQVEL